MRCLFLLHCIAIVALRLFVSPNIHRGGPVYLHPIIGRVRRQHIHSKRKIKQAPASHNYYTWRLCLLLLYAACFFTAPTAPTIVTQTHYSNTLTLDIWVTCPYNTRYNSNWVLQCGDVHPNPGHSSIYQYISVLEYISPRPSCRTGTARPPPRHRGISPAPSREHQPTVRQPRQRGRRPRPGNETGYLEHTGRTSHG